MAGRVRADHGAPDPQVNTNTPPNVNTPNAYDPHEVSEMQRLLHSCAAAHRELMGDSLHHVSDSPALRDVHRAQYAQAVANVRRALVELGERQVRVIELADAQRVLDSVEVGAKVRGLLAGS